VMTPDVWIRISSGVWLGIRSVNVRVRGCLGSLGGEYGFSDLGVIHSSGCLQIYLYLKVRKMVPPFDLCFDSTTVSQRSCCGTSKRQASVWSRAVLAQRACFMRQGTLQRLRSTISSADSLPEEISRKRNAWRSIESARLPLMSDQWWNSRTQGSGRLLTTLLRSLDSAQCSAARISY